ncbi:hypothetical protein [Virgibacillus salexigens]|uniref:Uncharacterized protein n=1 Tax=Virgibacillus massiliensis TaxID=1462526 RepID=A0A024QAH4_9BACI|nr:hypothetical protein [Virgibacillus massiliensis]CDQ39508.1 hypothetical protein BN990_01813 [Virgibacillus massiliensis]
MDERLERTKGLLQLAGVYRKKGNERLVGQTIQLIYEELLIDYLIQQTERVQELEKDNKRLKDLNSNNLPVMRSMHEKTERYKQTLEFYADESNHEYEVTYDMADVIESEVMKDYGNKAREALKGVEG